MRLSIGVRILAGNELECLNDLADELIRRHQPVARTRIVLDHDQPASRPSIFCGAFVFSWRGLISGRFGRAAGYPARKPAIFLEPQGRSPKVSARSAAVRGRCRLRCLGCFPVRHVLRYTRAAMAQNQW